jgi:CRP-like cAMP-binding protein
MPHEDTLATIPLFAGLERSGLSRLAKLATQRTYRAGETIVSEGEQAVAFYMVVSGKVEVVKGGAKLAELGPSEFFGDMALLDGFPRVATVRAVEDTECLMLTRWDFSAELHGSPDIAIAMLSVLSKRIRELEGEHVRW